MSDSLRDRIAAVHQAHRWGVFRCDDGYARTCCRCQWRELSDGPTHPEHVADAVIDAVIRELPELQYAHVPQRIMLSHASQDAERRRLDAASWLEKELAAAGLKCGAGWVLYNLVDGVVARLNGVAE